MNKRNIVFVSLFIATVAIMFVIVLSADERLTPPVPVTTSLPYEYRVSSFCQAEGNESVTITTTLGCNDRTIPIKGGEIEVGIFLSSDSDADFIIEDESGGYWIIFTSLVDGKREMDITWWSDNIRLDQTVTLPTGEEVTFLGFDPCEGDSRFSVAES